MATRSAGRLLAQWVEFESSLFTEDSDGKVCATSAPLGSLASDLVKLSNQKVNDWYPHYHKLKSASSKEKRTEIPPECRPEWQQQWSGATRDTKTVFARHGEQNPRQLDIMNSYWLMSRYKFRVMEKLDRVKKRLDCCLSRPEKRSRADFPAEKRRRVEARVPMTNPTLSRAAKRHSENTIMSSKRPRVAQNDTPLFGCDSKAPVRRGITAKRQCWICGYKISGKTGTTYSCCSRESHKDCWNEQRNPTLRKRFKKPTCCEVNFYLLKDRMTPDYDAKVETLVIDVTEGLHCGLCNTPLQDDESDTHMQRNNKKNH